VNHSRDKKLIDPAAFHLGVELLAEVTANRFHKFEQIIFVGRRAEGACQEDDEMTKAPSFEHVLRLQSIIRPN
jgi:hypothetical protein